MPFLVVLEGPKRGNKLKVDRSVTIGRSPDCDIQIPDLTVSRRQAALNIDSEDFVLMHLGGTNPTYINERLVSTPTKLREGDQLRMGEVILRFEEGMRRSIPAAVTIVNDELDAAQIVSRIPASESILDTAPSVSSFDELERLTTAVRTLHAIAKKTAAILELDKLLEEILGHLLDVFGESRRAVALMKPPGGNSLSQIMVRLRGQAAQRTAPADLVVSQTVLREVLERRSAVLSCDLRRDSRFDAQSIFATGAQALLCAPLVFQNEALGIFYVDSYSLGGFRPHDLELFNAITAQATNGVVMARLHQQMLKRQQIEQDLKIAERIQKSFLPKALPQIPGFAFSVRYQPARGVSGDYYDFVQLRSGHWAIVLADVSGKGVGAALHMARLTRDLRHYALEEADPAQILSHLNHAVLDAGQAKLFVTMVIAVIDPRSSVLIMANAGHFAPRIRHSGEGRLTRLESSAVPLGMFPDTEYTSETYLLQPGDTMFLFTDGLVEAPNPQGELLGEDALDEAILRGPSTPRAVLTAALSCVDRHLAGGTPNDDITALAVTYDR